MWNSMKEEHHGIVNTVKGIQIHPKLILKEV